MRLDDYHERDGKRVWLRMEEIDRMIEAADTDAKEIAFQLAGKAGLRRDEVVSVRRKDFLNAPNGFVRVWDDFTKGEKYREAPIPDTLGSFIRGYTAGSAEDDAILDVTGRTIYNWVRSVCDDLQEETGDEGWAFVDVHDLRRSWGGHLLWNCGVSPMSVMEFGGWSDWATFEEHYMGEMTPEARDRERGKIDFVGGEPEADQVLYEPKTPAAKQTFSS